MNVTAIHHKYRVMAKRYVMIKPFNKNLLYEIYILYFLVNTHF